MTRRYRVYPGHADAPLLGALGAVFGWGVGLIVGAVGAVLGKGKR